MNFPFLKDSLFLLCTAAYALNRWCLKPFLHWAFLRNWFSDLLLAPCAIPVLLWVFQKLGLRPGTERPKWAELAWILAIWSVLFEWAGPLLLRSATGDWRDVLMYWAGGVGAWCFWAFRYGGSVGELSS